MYWIMWTLLHVVAPLLVIRTGWLLYQLRKRDDL